MIGKRMFGRVLLLAAAVAFLSPAQDVAELDRFLLARALKSEVAVSRASAQPKPDAIKRAYGALSIQDPAASRLALMRALAELRGIAWTEAHDSAAAYRFLVAETIVEPGAAIHAVLERFQPGAASQPESITAVIAIQDDMRTNASEPRSRGVEELADAEFSFKVPAQAGTYSLTLDLKAAKSGATIASARARFWVIANVRARLAAMRAKAESLAIKGRSGSHSIWANTVLAVVERYSAATEASHRSPSQLSSPMVQLLAPIEQVEPLAPSEDLAWMEKTLAALEANQDPAGVMEGWIPIAVRSRKDQTLRLARVWWPRAKPSGCIILLGDMLSHDRSWSSAQFGGFVALAPSPRPGPGLWGDETWADLDDWITGLAAVSGVEHKTQFLLSHGAGAASAAGAMARTPARFPAAAMVAASSDRPLSTLPKGFPPLLLVEAGKDTVVPSDELRRAGIIFQRRLPGTFEYLVVPATTHDSVRDAVLPRVLEFFAGVASGTWKPSGTPVPSPGRVPQ